MRDRLPPILWIAFGAMLWGTDTVFRRPLTGRLEPVQIVLYEHLILALLVLPVLFRHAAFLKKLPAQTWLLLIGIGWIGSALATVLFTDAIRSGSPTTAVLLQKTQPLFALIFARIIMHERWPRSFPAVVLVAMAGTYLVAFGDGNLLTPLHSVELVPALLAIGAAVGWALATVWGTMASAQLPFELMTALRITCALPLLLVLAIAGHPAQLPNSHDIVSLFWMALIPGFAGLMLYYRGLQNTTASRATIAELAFPITASLLNWSFLAVPTSWLQIGGFAVVWTAILSLTPTRNGL